MKTRAELYDGIAQAGRALSSGRRLEIVDFLNQGPRSVTDLAAELGQSVANTSQHLQVLAKAGLVVSRRDQHRIVYELAEPGVGKLLSLLTDLAVGNMPTVAHLVGRHLGDRTDVAAISDLELTRRMLLGDVVVIDVRPERDFAAGHIEGALSVPLNKLDEFARGLNPSISVVAYCRGEYCSFADVAVRRLRERGVQAQRLFGGFPEWMAQRRSVGRTA